MHGTNLRYYSFVSRFVGTVSGEALTTELRRSIRARRLFEMAHLDLTQAPGMIRDTSEALPKAA